MLKRRHEKQSGKAFPGLLTQDFPGFISPDDLQSIMSLLGLRLSFEECRELSVLIASEKRGRIFQADLTEFIGRNCRSFGKLQELLEKDIIKPLVDVYRAHRNALLSPKGENHEVSSAAATTTVTSAKTVYYCKVQVILAGIFAANIPCV